MYNTTTTGRLAAPDSGILQLRFGRSFAAMQMGFPFDIHLSRSRSLSFALHSNALSPSPFCCFNLKTDIRFLFLRSCFWLGSFFYSFIASAFRTQIRSVLFINAHTHSHKHTRTHAHWLGLWCFRFPRSLIFRTRFHCSHLGFSIN